MRRGLVAMLACLCAASGVSGPRVHAQTPAPAADAPPQIQIIVQESPDIREETEEEKSRLSELGRAIRSADRSGDLAAAERAWREILAITERTYGPANPQTAAALTNLADYVDDRGRSAEAEEFYRRAVAITEARLGPTNAKTAQTLMAYGSFLNRSGRYAEAEERYRRAVSIVARERTPFDDYGTAAASLQGLALSLTRQYRDEEAAPFLLRAVELNRSLLGVNAPQTIRSQFALAGNFLRRDKYAEAETRYRQLLPLIELRYGATHPLMAEALRGLSTTLEAQARFADAEMLMRKVLAIDTARGGRPDPQTLVFLGVNLVLQKRMTEAEPFLQSALTEAERTFGADHEETLNVRMNVAATYLLFGDVAKAAPEARLALAAFRARARAAGAAPVEAAQMAMGSLTLTAAAVLLRADWATATPQTAAALRVEAFDAAQSLTNPAGASQAMLEGLARASAERAGVGDAVRAWRAARDRMGVLDGEASEAAAQGREGDARLREVSAARVQAARELAQAADRLRAFPRYFDLLQSPPVSVAELQAATGDNAKLLRDDEALVLLTPGFAGLPDSSLSRGFVFVITKQTTAWAELPLAAEALTAEVTALHAMLAAPGAGATIAPGKPAPTLTYDRTRAWALYRALFGAPEIAAALEGKTRWLLAPQGALMSLPFAALPIAAPPGGAGADADPAALRLTAWLGAERTLAILPSVSSLRVQRLYPLERDATGRTPFFGLGDPAFKGVADTDVRGGQLGAARSYFRGGVADLASISQLPRLPNTAAEIRALAENLGVGRDTYVLQLSASEAELRRRSADGRLGRAEIIAFATHGLVAGDFENAVVEPALALTPPVLAPGASLRPEDDGLLTASEVTSLNLSARFVILSACNTASGGAPDAEALSGLARAFLQAGAQSLLVSHYPVGDVAAMRLTTEAARLARTQDLRNPEAMRASMLALLQDASRDASGRSFSHPAAWAPFAVIDAN